MNCPDPEQAAACADGRLDPAEEAHFLEHCAECDDCRRALAIVRLSAAESAGGVSPSVRARILRAADRAPRPWRRRVFTRRPGYGHVAAAATLLLAAGVLAAVALRSRPAPVRETVQQKVPPAPVPTPEREDPPAFPAPRRVEEPPRKELATETPKPAPVAPEERPPEPLPESIVAEPVPKSGDTRTAEAPKPPSHTVAARVLSDLQVTDLSGPITVRRKSGRVEKLSGVATLADGDVLTAEKAASFHVDGRHPVVLGENTSISLAYVAQEEAPYLHLRAGEAMVDSTGPTRWVVTDGRVAVVVKQARARFAASPGEDRLAIAALSEPLFVQPDGGAIHSVRPGQELRVGKASAEVEGIDLARAQKKAAAFEAARPRQRTIFYTSCDPADARREHFFVQEGGYFRNEALLSASRPAPEKSAGLALSPNPRFGYRANLVLRCRVRTNATQLQVAFRVEERRYTLFKAIAVDRKLVNQWLPVEVPLQLGALQFRRDDGGSQLVVSSEDMFDSIRFSAEQQHVFGDQRVTFLVDDLQIVEKE